MNILQIKRLSVNSTSFDYYLWIRIGDTFINLSIGGNRVIVCSESTIVRSDVYFLVQYSPILFQWSVAALIQYKFVETFTAKFKFLLEVTSKQQYVLLHRHNISVHLNSSLKRPGSLLSCCSCFTQHVRGKKFATASAVKVSTQSFDRNLCHSSLISGLIQASSSFSARARCSKSVSISNSSNLFISQNLVKRLYYSSNVRSFAY